VGSDGGRRLAVPALLGTVLIWSSTFVVTRVFLEEADHFAVTAGRFLIVAAGIYINRIPVVGLIFALALGETTMGGIIAVSGVLLSEAAVR
jgi:drug/metabolite transporter (DMT)-like permease